VRTRFGVVRKSAAAAAVSLFVIAQPQMLCALHCMVFDHMGAMDGAAMAHAPVPVHGAAPSGGASGALTAPEHHPVAVSCGHGVNVITTPTLPVAAVGLATVTPLQQLLFEIRPTVPAAPGSAAVVVAYTPGVDTPPPRA